MNCTHCGDPLQRELRRGVEIDRCTSCGSVVLDRFELSSWLGASSTLEDQLAEAARGARATGECPRCHGGLTVVDTEGGAVELCLDCGTLVVDAAALSGRGTRGFSPRAAARGQGFDLDAAERSLDAATDAIDLSDLLELFSELLGAAGSLLD